MLVLSRRRNEGVTIGAGATAMRVVVVEIRGDVVRLGFQGDRNVPVLRDEARVRVKGGVEDGRRETPGEVPR